MIGSDKNVLNDVAFNYRMVDYDPSVNEHEMIALCCGEHRDFGSLTVIKATCPGIQIFQDNEWRELPSIPPGSALLLFGWCTQIHMVAFRPSCIASIVTLMPQAAFPPSCFALPNMKGLLSSLQYDSERLASTLVVLRLGS